MKNRLFLLIIILLAQAWLHADVLYLLSGEVFVGNIIEVTPEYADFDTHGSRIRVKIKDIHWISVTDRVSDYVQVAGEPADALVFQLSNEVNLSDHEASFTPEIRNRKSDTKQILFGALFGFEQMIPLHSSASVKFSFPFNVRAEFLIRTAWGFDFYDWRMFPEITIGCRNFFRYKRSGGYAGLMTGWGLGMGSGYWSSHFRIRSSYLPVDLIIGRRWVEDNFQVDLYANVGFGIVFYGREQFYPRFAAGIRLGRVKRR